MINVFAATENNDYNVNSGENQDSFVVNVENSIVLEICVGTRDMQLETGTSGHPNLIGTRTGLGNLYCQKRH